MGLEQSSAFDPFMRKLILFSLIASRTGNDKILRTVRSAARQRHDMINLVGRSDFLVAIVTAPPLELVLSCDIIGCMRAFCLLFMCVVPCCVGTFFTSVLDFPSMLRCANAIGIVFNPAFILTLSLLRVICHPSIYIRIMTSSAMRIKAIIGAAIKAKISPCSWVFAIALRTTLEWIRFVYHSVSLSPYHMMLPAGGVNCRFSGATLADSWHYTSRRDI